MNVLAQGKYGGVSSEEALYLGTTLLVAWHLKESRVLVVGGGSVATLRVGKLLETRACIRVVAPTLSTELRNLAARHKRHLRIVERGFLPTDLEGMSLVFVAIDNAAESAAITQQARARNIPTNVADKPQCCDFFMAASYRKGPLHVAVATDGQAPGLGVRIRDELLKALPPYAVSAVRRFSVLRAEFSALGSGAIAEHSAGPHHKMLGHGRRKGRDSSAQSSRRMAWLRNLAQSASWKFLGTLGQKEIRFLRCAFQEGEQPSFRVRRSRDLPLKPINVQLVGAGPGDPELLTRAAYNAIQEADVVLADGLVPASILKLVRGALYIAEKRYGSADAGQRRLESLMLGAARMGKAVVRLKCGDPSIFGRSGEEIEVLRKAGLGVRIIPGISSVNASIAEFVGTLTQRKIADRLLICTGQGHAGSVPLLPVFDAHCTYAFVMAVVRIEQLVVGLLKKGFPNDLPALCVAHASQPQQDMLTSTLGGIAAALNGAGIVAPATLIFGRVLGSTLHTPAKSSLVLCKGSLL